MLATLGKQQRDRTHVIVLADNGTHKDATSAPQNPLHGKPTVYEGGIHVPLIVSSPRVTEPGAECHALVNTTDLFFTITELFGFEPAQEFPESLVRGGYPVDSVSFAPYLADPTLPSIRGALFAEHFEPNGPGPYNFHDRAIRDERYKLLRFSPEQEEELYDLWVDPFEEANLLEGDLSPAAGDAYERLATEMRRLLTFH